MKTRRNDGSETWHRLLEWDKNQTASERLSHQVLQLCGYKSIDPSHPLGGKDGGKDAVCQKDGLRWVGAFYFPRGQQSKSAIMKKFKSDLSAAQKNTLDGIVFVTNQELSLAERAKMQAMAGDLDVHIIHLESMTALLNSPPAYGLRLEYLGMEMTKEEQISFIAIQDADKASLNATIVSFAGTLEKIEGYMSKTGKLTHEAYQTIKNEPIVAVAYDHESTSLFGKEARRCSFCKYGYYVEDPLGSPIRFTSTISGLTTYRSSLQQLPTRSASCPKCHNVDIF